MEMKEFLHEKIPSQSANEPWQGSMDLPSKNTNACKSAYPWLETLEKK